MSRGGWIMIIGGIVLLVGIALFAFGSASFLSAFAPDRSTLAVDAFQNRTVEVAQVTSALTYIVAIENFASGDELTVFIETPTGEERQRATVTGATLTGTYITTDTGLHTVVIQNTGEGSADILLAANVIDITAASLIATGTFLGFGGFVVFIIGLILWIVDRGKQRRQLQQQGGMPPLPPPTSPP